MRRTRKVVGIVVAALVVWPSTIPAHAEGPARRAEWAMAEWLLPTARDDRAVWLSIEVRRETSADGEVATVASLVKGKCRRSDGQGGATLCSGSPRRYRVGSGAFEFDLVKGTAKVRVRSGGFTHVVEWTAEDPVPDGLYWEQQSCSEGSGLGAASLHGAAARGRLFGVSVETKPGSDQAGLYSGARATQCP